MWEDYRKMFDGVRAPESLRGEVLSVKNVSFRKKCKVPAAVIAAVLAVLMAGTAFAAVNGWLKIDVFSDGEGIGYAMSSSIMKYPVSAFGPEVQKVSENRDGLPVIEELRFSSWDELCAFLGPDIPCVWPGDGTGWGTFQAVLFYGAEDHQLLNVLVTSMLSTPDQILAAIGISIYTEYMTVDTVHRKVYDTEGSFPQPDSYQMKNGLTAEVVRYAGSEEHPHVHCEGYFMRDGILYTVTAFGTADTQEDTLARLYAILDDYE